MSTASGPRTQDSHPRQRCWYAQTMSSGGGGTPFLRTRTGSCVRRFRSFLAERQAYIARIPMYTNHTPTTARKPAIRTECWRSIHCFGRLHLAIHALTGDDGVALDGYRCAGHA